MQVVNCIVCETAFRWHLSTLSDSGRMYCSVACRVRNESHEREDVLEKRAKRHRDILKARLTGLGIKELAEKYGYAESTVVDYLRRAGAGVLTHEPRELYWTLADLQEQMEKDTEDSYRWLFDWISGEVEPGRGAI